MTLHAIARRYAAALFDVVKKSGAADRAGADLSAIAEAVTGHAELSRVFSSPAVPAETKRAILAKVLDGASDVLPEVRRLLLLLADRDRLGIIADVNQAFRARMMQEQKIVSAEVVTASPLDEDRRAALMTALGRATGGHVTLTERVDPSIVGGVVATVGSVVYDGSITRQLERLRQRLLADV